jgi:hypothetical protein
MERTMDGSTTQPNASMPIAQLEAQITALAGQLNAATHRWMVLIAEFDRRKGWTDGAFVSCAHWLHFKCGLDLGAAREKVRVANALSALPKISEAMARGQLSYSKVRAVSRVANAANEEYFLSVALEGSTHYVERVVRHFRNARQDDALSREASQQASRELTYWFDEDGSVVFKARLPAVAGALLLNALRAAGDHLFKQRVSAETQEVTSEQHQPAASNHAMDHADALAWVAESFLNGGNSINRTADRYQVVVHVDSRTLSDDEEGNCEIEGGTPIPAETARRLGCDASRVIITENEKGEPLSIGRKSRTIPSAIRRALMQRDKCCQFPGCTHKRYLDGHHVRHWAKGGATTLGNLVMLCRFHHRAVHEGGIRIVQLDSGAFQFIRQDGRVFDGTVKYLQPWEWRDLVRTNLSSGLTFDPSIAVEDLLRQP